MVIMEMVKEFTGEEALIVHPHEVERRLDVFNPDVVGEAFDDGEELLINVLRFIQDFAHRAPAISLIDPRIDVILSFQVRRPGWGRFRARRVVRPASWRQLCAASRSGERRYLSWGFLHIPPKRSITHDRMDADVVDSTEPHTDQRPCLSFHGSA